MANDGSTDGSSAVGIFWICACLTAELSRSSVETTLRRAFARNQIAELLAAAESEGSKLVDLLQSPAYSEPGIPGLKH